MARSTTLTRSGATYLGDLIRAEWERGYNYVSSKLINPGATVLTGFIPLGQPVKVSGSDHVMILATDEASTTGLVAYDKPINLLGSATTDDLFMILKRGPALIDQDALPAKDSAGTSFTIATIVTALAALSPPIIAQRALTPTKTQTF